MQISVDVESVSQSLIASHSVICSPAQHTIVSHPSSGHAKSQSKLAERVNTTPSVHTAASSVQPTTVLVVVASAISGVVAVVASSISDTHPYQIHSIHSSRYR
eukprot:305605_1